MRLKSYSILLLFFVLFTQCTKGTKEPIVIDPPVELAISDFKFGKLENTTLDKDYFPIVNTTGLEITIPDKGAKTLIASYKTNATKVSINNIEQKSGQTSTDFTNEVLYTLEGTKGEKKEVKVKVNWERIIPTEVPHIAITTADGANVTSKETYLKGNISIDGKGIYTDFNATTEIRGRGNSTWLYPKKPYRIRLTQKSEVLGLPAARNWVLLANYLDPSLMANSVAMRIGRDLAVPFTNSTIPVDLTLNGEYKGSYVLTQHLEVDKDRINIGADGYLFELDTYYDEEFQFKSAGYNLPVMIKSPELNNTTEIAPIRADFESLESLLKSSEFPNNNYANALDIDAFARYILVYFLTGNEEINHPKSTYMHKMKGGKFSFGPIWDFDWAYGYEASFQHFTNPQRPLFWSPPKVGTAFFSRLFEDPSVKTAFKKHWTTYKSQHFAKLITFIDEYAKTIRASKARDEEKWKMGKNFDTEINNLKQYLRNRANYLDTFTSGF